MKQIKKVSVFAIGILLITIPFSGIVEKYNTPTKTQKNTIYNNIIDFETGYYHSGVILNTDEDEYGDEVWMWGSNENGELGINKSSSDTPVKLNDLPEGNLINLELNAKSSGVSIDTNYDGFADEVWVWGSNQNYQIGTSTSQAPTKLDLKKGNIIDFEMSNYENGGVILDIDGDCKGDEVWMWGINLIGELGSGTSSPSEDMIQTQSVWSRGNPIDLSLGYINSGVVIDTNDDSMGDEVWMWGNNSMGQLGYESEITYYSTLPEKITGLPEELIYNYGSLELGLTGEAGIIINNQLWTWGNNEFGQLGHDIGLMYSSTPSTMKDMPIGELSNLSMGYGYVAISIDNEVWTWGNNEFGQLGDGSYTSSLKPTPISSSTSGVVKQIDCGRNSMGVILEVNDDEYTNGSEILLMWGQNDHGQLGIGNDRNTNVPTHVNIGPTSKSGLSWFTTTPLGITTTTLLSLLLLALFLITGYLIYKKLYK